MCFVFSESVLCIARKNRGKILQIWVMFEKIGSYLSDASLFDSFRFVELLINEIHRDSSSRPTMVKLFHNIYCMIYLQSVYKKPL